MAGFLNKWLGLEPDPALGGIADSPAASRYSLLIYRELRLLEKVIGFLCGVVLTFILLLSVASGLSVTSHGFSQFAKVLAVGIAVAMAAALFGSMFGFLFGIPRLLQKGRPLAKQPAAGQGSTDESPSSSSQVFSTNTSLEEISDWLTKIIVGIGLVQFNTIIHYLYICSLVAASYIRAQPVAIPVDKSQIGSDIPVVFFFALIVTCMIASCLSMYLETRTRFTLLFLRMEKVNSVGGDLDFEQSLGLPISKIDPPESSSAFSAGPGGGGPDGAPPRQPKDLASLTPSDKKILEVAPSVLKNTIERAAYAVAQSRAGNAAVALPMLAKAAREEPDNPIILERLAEIQRLENERDAFVDTITRLVQMPVERTRQLIGLASEALLDALYLPPPKGYENAILISDFLVRDDRLVDLPLAHVRRACAFGQKYLDTSDRNSGEAIEARKEALASIEKVVELTSGPKTWPRKLLRKLYDPDRFEGNPRDNDLEVFKGDPDFEALIVA